ncbi:hypothetical protein N7495_006378 [Penicillium taxi]|uniref:uncharacterized protein n=1 Tax=Penicillium taxi TaxID=168475 RepID=UPI002545511B|nr:uncharacterized protein N7495_006378 [Penicillium taxi]KAJ5894687.1 hypothetical protein N7495_006378 [Penicillium taxi]
MVNDPDGARFVSGANLLAMNGTASLLGNTTYNTIPNFFTRRRPKYDDLGNIQVMDFFSISENVYAWTADHNLDVYAARGILVESQGPTWLYGTASEHQVLYYYELYQTKEIGMGMIQTESPYFQPVPVSPLPFTSGLFPEDPDFMDCTFISDTCAFSWGVGIMDSSSVYLLVSPPTIRRHV